MLPTFVIGLREGLEAALIVGIIAAFLRKQGRRDLLRWVLVGVAAALVMCFAAGLTLELYSRDLPQRQQEGLETVIGLLAVGMVTYMVIWMRRHSRQLKGQLEGMAADALASGGGGFTAGRAMVLMAFLAVIREGLETVVFLLAAFNEAGSSVAAGLGAVLGIAVAIGLGYGIYRGGVRLNLSKFFRATGLVLVLVAAGLVVNALHTAHEAGWLDIGQGATVDLSWLVSPGSIQASLLTGMLGIQSHPVVIEAIGWLVYLIPVAVYVALPSRQPPGRAAPARALLRISAAVCVLAAVSAAVLAWVAPDSPPRHPVTRAGEVTAQVVSRDAASALVRTQAWQPVAGTVGTLTAYRLAADGLARHGGIDTDVFRALVAGVRAPGLPATLTPAELAAGNDGRLPIGLGAAPGARLSASYRDTTTLTVWLDTRTNRVIDVSWVERVTLSVRGPSGAVFTLDRPAASARTALRPSAVQAAAAGARDDHSALDRRALLHTLGWWCLGLAVFALAGAVAFALALRRRRPDAPMPAPEQTLVRLG
ncbi:MAG TPA: iron uptake transporter permease EfeU [Jatrophihabitans sp.]|nr:iron uptake transporter permease EfeU [Jatrophihabitans sp.]